jgi:hypothetical protein
MKIVLRILGGIVVLVVLTAGFLYVRGEPVGPIAGRRLGGTLVTQPVSDWSFVNTPDRICQIQVDSQPPRAVNIGCFGENKYLYVNHRVVPNHRISWAELLALNPTGRIRVDNNLYPVAATQITDQAERQRIWALRMAISHTQNAPPSPPDNILIFRLQSQ